ncbi:MAG: Ig-like domain-containing protein [Gemmatimonadaceae bacterium]|jgi:uncharacterized protein YjdB|nr:Ig-like domain-containing protein [Gemmatimonadaceae bacterium]
MRVGHGLVIGLVVLAACGGGEGLISGPPPGPAPVRVTLTPATMTLRLGATGALVAAVQGGPTGTSARVRFTSSAPSVATVTSGDGATATITTLAPGTTTIVATAEADGSAIASSTVTVTDVPAARVELSPREDSTLFPLTRQLAAVVRDSSGRAIDGRALAWTTSDAQIATVSDAGVVTPIAPGEVTIRATSSVGVGMTGSVSGTTTFRVSSRVVLRLAPVDNATLNAGESRVLSASVLGGSSSTSRAVRWSSSNPTIATVSETGVVTAVGAGRVMISAVASAMGTARDSVELTVISVCGNRPSLPLDLMLARTLGAGSCRGDDTDGVWVEERMRFALPSATPHRVEFLSPFETVMSPLLPAGRDPIGAFRVMPNQSVAMLLLAPAGSYDTWTQFRDRQSATYSIRVSPLTSPPTACHFVFTTGSVSMSTVVSAQCPQLSMSSVEGTEPGGRITVRAQSATVAATVSVWYFDHTGQRIRETAAAPAAGQPAIVTVTSAAEHASGMNFDIGRVGTGSGTVTVAIER